MYWPMHGSHHLLVLVGLKQLMWSEISAWLVLLPGHTVLTANCSVKQQVIALRIDLSKQTGLLPEGCSLTPTPIGPIHFLDKQPSTQDFPIIIANEQEMRIGFVGVEGLQQTLLGCCLVCVEGRKWFGLLRGLGGEIYV